MLVPPVMALALIAGFGFVVDHGARLRRLLQERAPVELRGRVFAVQLMLSNLASIVPLLLLGGLADLIGVDVTLMLIGRADRRGGCRSACGSPEACPRGPRRSRHTAVVWRRRSACLGCWSGRPCAHWYTLGRLAQRRALVLELVDRHG